MAAAKLVLNVDTEQETLVADSDAVPVSRGAWSPRFVGVLSGIALVSIAAFAAASIFRDKTSHVTSISPTLTVGLASCTAAGEDAWQTGNKLPCCHGSSEGNNNGKIMCFANPTPAPTVRCSDGDVKAKNLAGGSLYSLPPNTMFLPYVWRTDGWYPICGNGFWDSDGGANLVCKKLGFTSGRVLKTSGVYSKDAASVGKCWGWEYGLKHCSAGENYFSSTDPSCAAWRPVQVQVSCRGSYSAKTSVCNVQKSLPAPSASCTEKGKDAWETGQKLPCCAGSMEALQDGKFMCVEDPSTCTAAGEDAWKTNNKLPCCDGSSEGNNNGKIMCFANPTPPPTVACNDGDVKAKNLAGGSLYSLPPNTMFLPYVWRTDGWYPICGNGFWDSDGGANLVCKTLGFTSGKVHKTSGVYSKDAASVGKCWGWESGLKYCSAGENYFSSKDPSCAAWRPVQVQVSCSGSYSAKTTSCTR